MRATSVRPSVRNVVICAKVSRIVMMPIAFRSRGRFGRRRVMPAVERRVEDRRVAEDLRRRAVVLDLLVADDRVRCAAGVGHEEIAHLLHSRVLCRHEELNSPLDTWTLPPRGGPIGRSGGGGLCDGSTTNASTSSVRIVGPDVERRVLLLAGVEARLEVGGRRDEAASRLGELQTRLRGRRRACRRRGLQRQAQLTKLARHRDALVDRLGHPRAIEVEDIVHRHFSLQQALRDRPAELALSPAAISWLFFSIRPQIAKKFVSAAVSMMWKYCDTSRAATRRGY